MIRESKRRHQLKANAISLSFSSYTKVEGSEWNLNFGMLLLGFSVVMAILGLLQVSPATIIGAMLVAPLMTPLIAVGLSLVQGNVGLLMVCARTTALSVFISLVLGSLLQIVTPGSELSMETQSRATPDLLDLIVAFFAGGAAAYAIVRPKLSGAMPGVAIG